MPKHPKRHVARPVPIQLPLFADAASLIRVRPERNEWNGLSRYTGWGGSRTSTAM